MRNGLAWCDIYTCAVKRECSVCITIIFPTMQVLWLRCPLYTKSLVNKRQGIAICVHQPFFVLHTLHAFPIYSIFIIFSCFSLLSAWLCVKCVRHSHWIMCQAVCILHPLAWYYHSTEVDDNAPWIYIIFFFSSIAPQVYHLNYRSLVNSNYIIYICAVLTRNIPFIAFTLGMCRKDIPRKKLFMMRKCVPMNRSYHLSNICVKMSIVKSPLFIELPKCPIL